MNLTALGNSSGNTIDMPLKCNRNWTILKVTVPCRYSNQDLQSLDFYIKQEPLSSVAYLLVKLIQPPLNHLVQDRCWFTGL